MKMLGLEHQVSSHQCPDAGVNYELAARTRAECGDEPLNDQGAIVATLEETVDNAV
jgi:hypothetical protein